MCTTLCTAPGAALQGLGGWRASCMLGQYSVNWAALPALCVYVSNSRIHRGRPWGLIFPSPTAPDTVLCLQILLSYCGPREQKSSLSDLAGCCSSLCFGPQQDKISGERAGSQLLVLSSLHPRHTPQHVYFHTLTYVNAYCAAF